MGPSEDCGRVDTDAAVDDEEEAADGMDGACSDNDAKHAAAIDAESNVERLAVGKAGLGSMIPASAFDAAVAAAISASSSPVSPSMDERIFPIRDRSGVLVDEGAVAVTVLREAIEASVDVEGFDAASSS